MTSYNIVKDRMETNMDNFEKETLDYFYEELESYYDEDEQGDIYDGYDF